MGAEREHGAAEARRGHRRVGGRDAGVRLGGGPLERRSGSALGEDRARHGRAHALPRLADAELVHRADAAASGRRLAPASRDDDRAPRRPRRRVERRLGRGQHRPLSARGTPCASVPPPARRMADVPEWLAGSRPEDTRDARHAGRNARLRGRHRRRPVHHRGRGGGRPRHGHGGRARARRTPASARRCVRRGRARAVRVPEGHRRGRRRVRRRARRGLRGGRAGVTDPGAAR